jgi:hypothetical protein
MKQHLLSYTTLLVVLLSVAGCGGGGGGGGAPASSSPFGIATEPAVETTIGPAGGSLSSGDGKVTVLIPAGALAVNTTISIQPFTNTAPGGNGSSYRFAPSGVVFSAPVQITFPFTDADIASSAKEALNIGYQDDQGAWWIPKNAVRDDVAKTITVASTHFSVWSSLLGWQIVPGEKTVKGGERVALTVLYCEPVSVGDELATLLSQCATDNEIAPLVSGWAVDGTPGGTLAAGVVNATGAGQATYTAPAIVSGQEVHAVSVDLIRKNAASKRVQLVSNLTVVGDGSYTVTGTYRENPSSFPCSFGTSDMSDRVAFEVNPDAAANSVAGIDNGTTTFTPPQPIVSGGRIAMDVNPEYLTAASGVAFKPTGQPNIVQVSLNGTTKIGACTLFVGEVRVSQSQTMTSPRGVDFSFDTTRFVNRTQTVEGAPGGTDLGWTWVITQN